MGAKKMISEDVNTIYQILAEHNALIVHFSGAPKGSGNSCNDHLFPDDLKNVIDGKAQGGLSCSTVMPNDIFSGIERNATGCIGLILGLKEKDSLVSAESDDRGSYLDESGSRLVEKRKISKQDIRDSIVNRSSTSYNEWVVKNYYIIGVFAISPMEVSVRQNLPPELAEAMGVTFEFGIKPVTVENVKAMFSTQRIFSFYEEKIVEYFDNKFIGISHNGLYPTTKRT